MQPLQRCVSGAQQKREKRKPQLQIAADEVVMIGRTRVRGVVHRLPAGPSTVDDPYLQGCVDQLLTFIY